MAATRLLVPLLVMLLGTYACGGNGPAPSPLPPSSPSPSTFSLTGRISNQETGGGVAGAALSIVDGPNAGRSTNTDEAGRYTFNALQQSGFSVGVSAEGYFATSAGVMLTSDRTLNFSLRPLPTQITLTGRVTDAATGRPIAGSVVYINGRYRGTADADGQFVIVGLLDAGSHSDVTYASAEDYAPDYHYIRGTTQNIRLHRVERIVAGASKDLTVAPDDTLCINNVHDTPGLGPDHVCRSVRVSVPANGVMTLEAVSTQDGTHPPLEVEINSDPVDFTDRNPRSFPVMAGIEVLVNVEIPASSTTSQTFRLTTAVSQP